LSLQSSVKQKKAREGGPFVNVARSAAQRSTDHAPFLGEPLQRLLLGIRFAHTRDLTL
jgi:hypothetical protein